jgi:D-lactate dehydrogenase (cytochrome)
MLEMETFMRSCCSTVCETLSTGLSDQLILSFTNLVKFKESQRKTAEDLIHRMVDRAIEMEGTVTGEHGIGLVKRDYLDIELGKDTVDTMRKLKGALDPLCLLNCDKIVRMEK